MFLSHVKSILIFVELLAVAVSVKKNVYTLKMYGSFHNPAFLYVAGAATVGKAPAPHLDVGAGDGWNL